MASSAPDGRRSGCHDSGTSRHSDSNPNARRPVRMEPTIGRRSARGVPTGALEQSNPGMDNDSCGSRSVRRCRPRQARVPAEWAARSSSMATSGSWDSSRARRERRRRAGNGLPNLPFKQLPEYRAPWLSGGAIAGPGLRARKRRVGGRSRMDETYGGSETGGSICTWAVEKTGHTVSPHAEFDDV